MVTNLAETQLDLVEIVELGSHPDVAVAGDVGGLLGAQHELELGLLEPRASWYRDRMVKMVNVTLL